MPGEDGVLQLRKDGLVVPEHPGEQRLSRGDPGDGIAAEFLFDRNRQPAGGFQLSEGCCIGVVSHVFTVVRPAEQRSPQRRSAESPQIASG